MRGIHEGTLSMTSDGRVSGIVNGIVNGDSIVHSGCRVRVGGIVNGDVVVEEGAQARVTGILNGRVIELGGRGTVDDLLAES